MSSNKECITCKETKDCYLFRKGRSSCKECNSKKSKCEHLKQKSHCKICEGSSICEHDKIKYRCIDCKGSQICDHLKQKSSCIDCKGGSICEHLKQRSQCKDCKGGSICIHNIVRSRCRDCGGGSLCIHDKQKYICKECNGSSICIHNIVRSRCRDCGGGSLCIHYKEKSKCKDCLGSSYCIHEKLKSRCKECRGCSICEHNKIVFSCIICTPDKSCKECKGVLVDKRTHCYPLCQACFCNKYPDHERSTLYKIKERYLRDELRERFPNNEINMIFDKAVDGGCSNKRPDVLIELLTHCIIIECDEHQHKNYTCENKRTMQLFEDLGNRPLVIIRFNPDNYNEENGNKVEGCFKPLIEVQDMHKRRFYNINETEWNRRMSVLEKIIKEYIDLNRFPSREVTEIKLFYNDKLLI